MKSLEDLELPLGHLGSQLQPIIKNTYKIKAHLASIYIMYMYILYIMSD